MTSMKGTSRGRADKVIEGGDVKQINLRLNNMLEFV